MPSGFHVHGIDVSHYQGNIDWKMLTQVMAQYKLVPTDVSAALAEQNIEAAPGQFGERGNQTFQMCIRDRLKTVLTTHGELICWTNLEYSKERRL